MALNSITVTCTVFYQLWSTQSTWFAQLMNWPPPVNLKFSRCNEILQKRAHLMSCISIFKAPPLDLITDAPPPPRGTLWQLFASVGCSLLTLRFVFFFSCVCLLFPSAILMLFIQTRDFLHPRCFVFIFSICIFKKKKKQKCKNWTIFFPLDLGTVIV